MGYPGLIRKMHLTSLVISLSALNLVSASFDLSALGEEAQEGFKIVRQNEENIRPLGTFNPDIQQVKEEVDANEDGEDVLSPTTPKRKRKAAAISADAIYSLDDPKSLDLAVKELKIHKLTDRAEMRKVIGYIQNNDYESFRDNEKKFCGIFKVSDPAIFSRDGKTLMDYMVKYGATNFIPYFGRWNFYHGDERKNSFTDLKALLDQRPLDIFLVTVSGFDRINLSESERAELKELIRSRYPNLNSARNFLIDMIGERTGFIEDFNQFLNFSDIEVFKKLPEFSYNASNESAGNIILDYLVRNIELYNQCQPTSAKFEILGMVIDLDNPAVLFQLLELDPGMYYQNGVSMVSRHYSREPMKLMDLTLIKGSGSPKCFSLFVDIIPQWLFENDASAIDKIFQKPGVGKLIAAMNQFNYRWDHVFKKVNFNDQEVEMNFLQYAFFKSYDRAVEFYLTEIDLEVALNSLKRFWPTSGDLIKHAVEKESIFLIRILGRQLRIDLAYPGYSHNGRKGNAYIFLPKNEGRLRLVIAQEIRNRYI